MGGGGGEESSKRMSPKRGELIRLGNRLNLGISVLQVIWHEFTKFPEYQPILGVSLKYTHTQLVTHILSCPQLKSIVMLMMLWVCIWDLVTANSFAKCCHFIKMIYVRTTFLVLYYSFKINNNWKHIKHILSVTSFESAKHILNIEEEVFPTSLYCWR